MLIKILYISVICLGTVTAQLMLKRGLVLLGGIDFSSGFIVEMLRILPSPYIACAVLIQGIIALFWIYIMSRLQLVYLFAMSGAFFYISLALASWIVLGEKLSWVQWTGIMFISMGVICLNLRPA